MLQNIRDNSTGIIAKTIVGLIAITFVITGINFFSGSPDDPVLANVGGIEVTERQFNKKMEQERRQLMQVLQDPQAINENLLKQSVLNALIEDAAAQSYSLNLGFDVSDQLVDQAILGIPQFRTDGQFDPVRYDQALRGLGLSRLGFREELERNLFTYQLKGGIEGSAMVFPNEAKRLAELQFQTRSGFIATIDIEKYIPDLSVSDAEIEAYYTNNSSRFLTTEKARLEYVTISTNEFLSNVKIPDAAVRSAYDEEVSLTSEETERRARHVLIANADDALDRAKELRTQILNGKPFEDVAREASDDIASRETGGDLGFAPSGTFAPEFEVALNTLPLNTLSEPVKTEYGYHLIEVLEARTKPIDPFEIREPIIRDDLEQTEARRLLTESLEEFSNIAFSGSLEELKKAYGVDIRLSELVDRTGGEGFFSKPELLRRAFAEDLRSGELNAEVFEVEPDVWMTFRIKSYEPSEVQSLETVKASINDVLVTKKALEAAVSDGEILLGHWTEQKPGIPENVIKPVLIKEFNELTREGSEEIATQFIPAIFAVPAPGNKNPGVKLQVLNDRQVIVSRIDSVTLGVPDDDSITQLKAALTQLRTEQEGREYWSVITSQAEIVRP